MPRFIQRSPIIAGLGAALVLGYDYHSIRQWAESINSSGALGSVGTGFWVCCVGDALAIAAGIGLMSSERKAKQATAA
jgi:N6-adenosine-specific RNA methylase IME4